MVSRQQVLAYRIGAHQLDRSCADPEALAVLDLGIQRPTHDAAATALAARLPTDADPRAAADRLTPIWSHRGAPHLHRGADLAPLAKALWPRSEPDALARLSSSAVGLEAAGLTALHGTAQAMRDELASPKTKGELSAAVTARLPSTYSVWCRGCQATHVREQLFRLAGLPAGAAIQPDAKTLTFDRLPRWRIPRRHDRAGARAIVSAYLRLHGPATQGDAAGFVGTTVPELAELWPDDLEQVRVGKRTAWIPADRLAALEEAAPQRMVRLLPPADPLLQGRDRATLVPDRGQQKEVWRILGNPGALLVDGAIVGTWRAKAAKRSRLAIEVTAWTRLSARARRAIEDEAAVVAAVRGKGGAQIAYATG